MQNIGRKIEIAANVSIFILAILICTVLIRDRLSSRSPIEKKLVGTHILLSGFDWAKTDKTLIIVMSPTCGFCKASLPFYRKLSQGRTQHHFQMVAVFPEPSRSDSNYLQQASLDVDGMFGLDNTQIGPVPTPTLLLVDQHGTVSKAWSGMLPPDLEKDVLQSL